MRQRSPAGNLVLEYLNRFPDSPDKTLARKIYKENPAMFKSLETCHQSVRMYRGHQGKKQREKIKEKGHFKPLTFNTNPFNIPAELDNDFEPFVIQQSKILSISDLHFPAHSFSAINCSLEYGQKKGVNTILINGDLFDFPKISRHAPDWRSREVHEEFQMVRQFLEGLRAAFPKARIIFKEGNHDERWENWLYVKAPEIFNDPEFKLAARLKLAELGIEIVQDRRIIHIGKLTVLHGHEFIGGGGGGMNPSTGIFNKTLENVLVGHFHKRSSREETTLGGHVISVNTTGCLCKLNPMYARINRWGHGFAYIEHDLPTGEYRLENLKIINGKVY